MLQSQVSFFYRTAIKGMLLEYLSNNEFHFRGKDHDGEFCSQRKVINNIANGF